MELKNYYTVKEIADLLQVSKTTIQKIVKAADIDFDHMEKNRQYYSLDQTKEIIKNFKPDFDFSIFENQSENLQTKSEKEEEKNEKSQTDFEKSQTKNGNSQTENTDQIQTLNRMLDLIQKQLEEKDKQLAIKDKQIEDLSERLKEAMHLTKEAQFITAADKTQQLLEVGKPKDPAADPEIIEHDPAAPSKKRKGLFARFFS